MRTIIVVSLALIVTGCETRPIDVQVYCPAVKSWSPTEQQQILAGLNSLPQDSVLRVALRDYERMRDESRACPKPQRK